jgi:hypothetical protein
MKNRRGKLNNKANTTLTIPEIDFIMEELKKGESSLTENHVQPNVKIHERINEASLQMKNIFQDIRKMPFYKVIEQMNRDMFGKFNPEILLEFVNRLMATLVGKEVMLTNERIGTVVMVNPYDPLKVLLKTSTGIMDLRMEKEWQIERIFG